MPSVYCGTKTRPGNDSHTWHVYSLAGEVGIYQIKKVLNQFENSFFPAKVVWTTRVGKIVKPNMTDQLTRRRRRRRRSVVKVVLGVFTVTHIVIIRCL